MARADGRVEPGQSLKSAFSARAWNRAQDAADIVLNERTVFGAGPSESMTLPSVRVKLAAKGWFGQCRFAVNREAYGFSPGSGLFPQTPASNDSLGSFSDTEKLMLNETLPVTRPSGSVPAFIPTDFASSGLFVCVGNDSNLYAMSGLAFTRVRVFNYLHRFVRNPQPFPGQTQEMSDATSGCLDSSFWGVARIVGYWSSSNTSHFNAPGLSYPNFEYRWALIQF
jgi:hypothetical protein